MILRKTEMVLCGYFRVKDYFIYPPLMHSYNGSLLITMSLTRYLIIFYTILL